MRPYGSKIIKRYSSYKLQPHVLILTYPEISPNNPHKITLRFLFPSLTIVFENFKFTIVAYGKIIKPRFLMIHSVHRVKIMVEKVPEFKYAGHWVWPVASCYVNNEFIFFFLFRKHSHACLDICNILWSNIAN